MKLRRFKLIGIFLLSVFTVVGLGWLLSSSAEAQSTCYCTKQSPSYGGSGGDPFSDGPFFGIHPRLSKIIVRSGSRVDSIQCEWTVCNGQVIKGAQHGGNGGSPNTIVLDAGEYINSLSIRSGAEVDSIQFSTNKGRTYGPYGGTGGEPHTINQVNVCGFFGRSGARVDAIGVITN